MGQTLYLECASGISGDMTVAALLDLGASRQKLDAALASLPLDGFEVVVSRVSKNGIAACDFDVRLDAAHENHDHDMDWLFGHDCGGEEGRAAGHGGSHGEHEHEQRSDAGHGHASGCGGEAAHAHGHHSHHEHRTLANVLAVLDTAELTPGARSIAERVFAILAEAEAQAHGTTPDQVHFHEVGAVDSIVDIVSAAVCLDDLGVDRVVVTELAEGCGTIRCAHGIIPVPVPAVCAIASTHRLPLRPSGVRGELVTPTGAAIAAAVRTDAELPGRYTIKKIGIGAGKRNYERCPSILRAMLIEPAEQPSTHPDSNDAACAAAGPDTDTIWKLECDVDDCTGEALGLVVEELMDAGAREAHCLSLVTKKGRPAWQVQVICTEDRRSALEALLFEETTTIGIRRMAMERTVLPRRAVTVQTTWGPMEAKEVVLPSGRRRTYPEHAAVLEAARRAGVSYQDAWQACVAACSQVR